MALDPAIALQIQQPNPANMISGFLDLGQKQVNLTKSRATLASDIEQRKAESSSAQSAATVSAATVPSDIAQKQANSATAQTQSELAKYHLTGEYAQKANDIATSLSTDPDVVNGNGEGIIDKLTAAKQQAISMGIPARNAEVMFAPLIAKAAQDPKSVARTLQNIVQSGMSAPGQAGAIAPSGPMINNGQQFGGVNTNPFAAGGVGSPIPGTAGQQQIPPTAATVVNGQPGYVGPQAASRPGAAPVASGFAPGQVAGVEGPTATNIQHFDSVVKEATAAPTRIGVLQNIKALAPDAVTGDAPTLKKIVSKLAAYTGWTGSEQTPTDVMAKEAALLASKGGNTDLARTLNEAATPNGHMTKDAILATADQLIGQEKLKVAAQQFFSGTPPNSPQYAQKLAAWNKVADPRAFEFAAKSPAERQQMLSKMSAPDKAALKANMQQLHMMGVDPE